MVRTPLYFYVCIRYHLHSTLIAALWEVIDLQYFHNNFLFMAIIKGATLHKLFAMYLASILLKKNCLFYLNITSICFVNNFSSTEPRLELF
jgi:hypothetical protein